MDRAKDVSPKVILSVSLYADLTRINYWARESERLTRTPATVPPSLTRPPPTRSIPPLERAGLLCGQYPHIICALKGVVASGPQFINSALRSGWAALTELVQSGADSYHYSLYPDLTRINYWARESECWRGTPDPVYL